MRLQNLALGMLCGVLCTLAVADEKSAPEKSGKENTSVAKPDSDKSEEKAETDENSESTVPEDFLVVYQWVEGSVPPPYHYEYSIRVRANGKGEIRMIPDYPGQGVPEWRETFKVKPERLAKLHAGFTEQEVYSKKWHEPKPEETPIGGPSDWMTVTADGEKTKIPAYAQGLDAEAVYGPVRRLVPKATWKKLDDQRESYQKEHAPKDSQ
jgi:hypothetical protein